MLPSKISHYIPAQLLFPSTSFNSYFLSSRIQHLAYSSGYVLALGHNQTWLFTTKHNLACSAACNYPSSHPTPPIITHLYLWKYPWFASSKGTTVHPKAEK